MVDGRTVSALAAVVMLTGCGSHGGNSATAAGPSTSSAGPTHGLDWAREPCQTFTPAAASKASGLNIVKAEKSGGSEGDGTANATCDYQSDGKDHFTVMLRIVTDGSQTAKGQIDELAGNTDMMGPVVAVPTATGQARWLPKLHEIVYFPDDARAIYVVSPGFRMFGKSDPEADQQKQALAIATAAAAT